MSIKTDSQADGLRNRWTKDELMEGLRYLTDCKAISYDNALHFIAVLTLIANTPWLMRQRSIGDWIVYRYDAETDTIHYFGPFTTEKDAKEVLDAMRKALKQMRKRTHELDR